MRLPNLLRLQLSKIREAKNAKFRFKLFWPNKPAKNDIITLNFSPRKYLHTTYFLLDPLYCVRHCGSIKWWTGDSSYTQGLGFCLMLTSTSNVYLSCAQEFWGIPPCIYFHFLQEHLASIMYILLFTKTLCWKKKEWTNEWYECEIKKVLCT